MSATQEHKNNLPQIISHKMPNSTIDFPKLQYIRTYIIVIWEILRVIHFACLPMGLYFELNLSNRWKVFLSYNQSHIKITLCQSKPHCILQREQQGCQHLSHRPPTVNHQIPVVVQYLFLYVKLILISYYLQILISYYLQILISYYLQMLLVVMYNKMLKNF